MQQRLRLESELQRESEALAALEDEVSQLEALLRQRDMLRLAEGRAGRGNNSQSSTEMVRNGGIINYHFLVLNYVLVHLYCTVYMYEYRWVCNFVSCQNYGCLPQLIFLLPQCAQYVHHAYYVWSRENPPQN